MKKQKLKYCVYILYSERDGGVFIDHTDDLALEMARHEAGEIRFTKYRLPVKLIHKEVAKSFNQVKMQKRLGKSEQKGVDNSTALLKHKPCAIAPFLLKLQMT